MNLTELMPQRHAVVVGIDADPTLALRYQELGLRPGAAVTVTQRAAFGGRVLAIGTDRFALDRTTCRRIRVEHLDEVAQSADPTSPVLP